MNYQQILTNSLSDSGISLKYAEVLYSAADAVSAQSDDLFASYLLESKMSQIIAENKLNFLLDKDYISIKLSYNNPNSFDILINHATMSPQDKEILLANLVEAIKEAD